ncbi:tRNA pseudouridine(55) synthase TruB [Synechococcus sp. CS-1332]|uniref:tRNA pseudouridine(55) synthase TruB n=1 Tax=Synechococcus sp. CS-1332 TaxID=2847972 RepID=UPI00223ADF0C|nr:tRNA pseudouridine(55) synthase TruB [Synechococcus sp. CS-1332]MCT0206965.1 tRNA pseudouridine(55) synthase TruB [Synechococcus sp. CS-1332]
MKEGSTRLPPTSPSRHGCGFLVIDKPAGLTSHDVVARVRKASGLRRVGHGGTLDPAVTGVLPIALGPATRLLPYLPGDKTYRGTVKLGLRTSSDDLEGEVLEQQAVPSLGAEDLERALARFRGEILQVPPQVSAVHVDGQRAYARVRAGEQLALTARPVVIHGLDLLGWDPASGRLDLEVRCSAGTYVRALARDLGEALGCGGALASLRRTAALGFGLHQAISLERLASGPLPPLLDPLDVLVDLPRQRLDPAQLSPWRCGRSLPRTVEQLPEGAVAVLTPDGSLAGIARADGKGLLLPRLVFDATG